MHRRSLLAATPFFLAPAWAASETWPSHALKFIVAWPPAGLNDLLARAYNDRVAEAIGSPLVLLNRPGFGGVIGTTEAAKAPPDGYTLAMGTLGPLTIAPHLRSDLQYSMASFEPVAMLAISPMVLAVAPDVPARTVAEFIALAKARPGALNFAGMGGIGTTQHLGFELFKQAASIDVATVPFKGTSDALPALMTNQVQVTLDTLGPLLPQIKAGTLRALAVTSQGRATQLPDVPTLTESGFASVAAFTWHIVLAPAGTPVAILDKLHAAYAAAAQSPQVQSILSEQSLIYQASTRAQLRERIAIESAMRRKIIAERGIKLQ
jgi:tripartite-type tricarboxylate transporter receptor subunit TctC